MTGLADRAHELAGERLGGIAIKGAVMQAVIGRAIEWVILEELKLARQRARETGRLP